MRILASCLVLCALSFDLIAQNCAVESDSIVCKGEIISFKPQYTGTASSFYWEFGDGSTNNQKNTTHSYSKTGSMTVKLTVNLSGGGSCVATRSIYVHDIPKPAFVLNTSEYCLSIHEICLTDNSSMGNTTNGYDTRTIVWGDGGLGSNTSPIKGQKICYNQYDSAGTYTINIEVKNDKGCEANWSQNITILKDYIPEFKVKKGNPDCNRQEVCFVNEDSIKPAAISSFQWDFGDGNTNTVIWDSLCHTFTNPGTQLVALKTILNNGCENVAYQNFSLSFPKVETDVTQLDSVNCYPHSFKFTNPLVAGANYSWEIYDSSKSFLRRTGTNVTETVVPPAPGYFYMRLRLSKGTCEDLSPFYKINSLGIDASFKPFNASQCALEDTVYFDNRSRIHPKAQPYYLWMFKDDSVQGKCTTWRQNCNFDTAEDSRHFYLDTGCYFPVLYAYDLYSGCVDSSEGVVNILDPDGAEFTYDIDLPCAGDKIEYTIRFDNNLCFAKIRALFDSCTGQWEEYSNSYLYDTVCNDSGWFSLSFAVQTGDSLVWRSHNENDYYIDNRKVCKDTVHYHNWFQLHPQPSNEFEFFRDSCLPDSVKLVYKGGDEGQIDHIEYNWGTGGDMEFLDVVDSVPHLYYQYTEEGEYHTIVQITDTFGCYNAYGHVEKYGYFNMYFYDSLICSGDSIKFRDSVRYWNDAKAYWNVSTNIEKVKWDFDDGKGFSVSGNNPVHTFPDRRDYLVRMLTNDKHGCTDTFTRVIHAGGVNAGIYAKSRELLCDQIAQFFDSSSSDFDQFGDRLIIHYWDFGDFTAPSYKENPFHLYNSGKQFTITHVVTSELGCSDTAFLEVTIIGPGPEFDFVTDSVGCEPFTVTVKSESKNVSDYIWSMGDSNNSTFSYKTDTSVTFTYTDPGIYYIYLKGADSFYNQQVNNYYTCTAMFPDTIGVPNPILKRVIVLPIPHVDFDWNQPACLDQEFEFYNRSDPRYEYFNWYINEDTLYTESDTLWYTFRDTGHVMVSLWPGYIPQGTYERACYDSLIKDIYVSDVEAGLTFTRDNLCSVFEFKDSSRNAVEFLWNFDHPQSGSANEVSGPEASHDYLIDTGFFNVCLTVRNVHGCEDTACQLVEARYYEFATLYNVFTPNGDLFNDDFGMEMINPELYSLRIYNRWGELVFMSEDPRLRWNGQLFNTGEPLPDGDYFYVFRYSFKCTNDLHESQGMVMLIR